MSSTPTETDSISPRAAAINLFALIGQDATWYLKGYRPLKELTAERSVAGQKIERQVITLQKQPSIRFSEEMVELLFERESAGGFHSDTIFFLARNMRILCWRGRCTIDDGTESYGYVELAELDTHGLTECFKVAPERFGRMLDAILEIHRYSFAVYRQEYARLRASARIIALVKSELIPD